MTVIAVKDGVMAADGFVWSGGIGSPVPFPKIVRGPNGLLGLSGPSVDCRMVRGWFANGERESQKPKGIGEDDRGIVGLILRPDGSVWYLDWRLFPVPDNELAVMGESDAATFVEGAMRAGASAEEAVRLAVYYCQSAGGIVQVECWK